MIDKKEMVTQTNSEKNTGIADDVMESLRKELRKTRIVNGILSALLVCVLTAGVLVSVKVQGYVEKPQPLVEKLTAVDYEVLNETMVNLNVSLNEIDWEQISGQLSELDIEALNEAIAGLDTEELSVTLENLNKAIEALQNFSDTLKSFVSKFNFGNTTAGEM